MSPPTTWTVKAPSHTIGGDCKYILSHPGKFQDKNFFINFEGYISKDDPTHYLFDGDVYVTPKYEPDYIDETFYTMCFMISGEGTITPLEGSKVKIEATFKTVEGKENRGDDEQVRGGGKLSVVVDEKNHGEGSGSCVFEGMNEAGAELM